MQPGGWLCGGCVAGESHAWWTDAHTVTHLPRPPWCIPCLHHLPQAESKIPTVPTAPCSNRAHHVFLPTQRDPHPVPPHQEQPRGAGGARGGQGGWVGGGYDKSYDARFLRLLAALLEQPASGRWHGPHAARSALRPACVVLRLRQRMPTDAHAAAEPRAVVQRPCVHSRAQMCCDSSRTSQRFTRPRSPQSGWLARRRRWWRGWRSASRRATCLTR